MVRVRLGPTLRNGEHLALLRAPHLLVPLAEVGAMFLKETDVPATNGWNRLAVGFQQPVDTHVSHRHPTLEAIR